MEGYSGGKRGWTERGNVEVESEVGVGVDLWDVFLHMWAGT